MQNLRRYLILSVFLVCSMVTFSTTNFLPLEDNFFMQRTPISGVSVEDIKPYRASVAAEVQPDMSYAFGSKDVLLCVFLLGVYILIQRKNKSRAVDF